MSNKYKVAIIGAGFIANVAHIPAWRSLACDVEIVALVDVRKETAEETAKRHSIPYWFDNVEEMLDKIKPDIVSVTTPNRFHKECTTAALEAGAHVMCEKPLTVKEEDGREMYATARRCGKMLFVSQTARFGAGTLAAKALYDEGYVGTPYFGEANIVRRRGVPRWGFFHMKEHNEGGPGYDLGVHALDTILWIMGSPSVVSVSGKAYSEIEKQKEFLVDVFTDDVPPGAFIPRKYSGGEFDVEDFMTAFIRLENNITLNMKVSWALNAPEEANTTYIAGTKGGLRISPTPEIYTTAAGYMINIVPKFSVVDTPFYGHHRAAAHFLRAIRGEEELIVTEKEVLNVLRILDLLYKSDEKNFETSI